MAQIDPTNLFVTNFSWGKTVEDMKELFAPYGEFDVLKDFEGNVKTDQNGNTMPAVTLIMDKETGRSRGFGFVKFVNADDAAKACANVEDGGLNGAEVDGRNIAVVVAKPREERPAYAPRNNY